MFLDEYKKLLSWTEIRKLNSFEELNGLPLLQQVYFIVISLLRALVHWQVWISIAFLVLSIYLGIKVGSVLGLKIGSLNLGTLLGLIVGASVYTAVFTYEAKKVLHGLLQKKDERKKA